MARLSVVGGEPPVPEFVANLKAALQRAEAGEFYGVALVLHTKDGEPEIVLDGADTLALACLSEEMGRMVKLQLLELVSE